MNRTPPRLENDMIEKDVPTKDVPHPLDEFNKLLGADGPLVRSVNVLVTQSRKFSDEARSATRARNFQSTMIMALVVIGLVNVGAIYYNILAGRDRAAQLERAASELKINTARIAADQSQFLVELRATGLVGRECLVKVLSDRKLTEGDAIAKFNECVDTK